METQYLRAFVTVAHLQSFTAAAERLHLTQPAISKRISSLEQQLNCRLFDRVNRAIRLTPAGTALLPRAEQILLQVADTEQAIANLAGRVRGTLPLVTSHHIGLHHLPVLLKRFTQRFPEAELQLEFADSERAYEVVLAGEAEIGITTLSGTARTDIENHSLWNDPLAFVVAADHPLATATQVDLAELAAVPAILPDSDTRTTQLISALFDAHSLQLPAGMTTNYLETIKMMVSIGLGWSALPHTMLDDSLAVLQVPGAHLQRQLGYIHHRQRTLSNAAQAFLQVIRASTGQPPGAIQQSSDRAGH